MANGLDTLEGCQRLFEDLLETPPEMFGRQDLALLNLLCAPTLPGSENLDIPKCLARLDRLTEFVRAATERSLPRSRSDPDYGHSEPMWRMAMLVTLVKRDFGASYSPSAKADLAAGIDAPFTDSREIFLHGLLDDDPKRRWGTCTSIPVLVAAVARRLRYPVGLSVSRRHVYARWEGGGLCFNIEASNPMGMAVLPDEHYRNWPIKLPPEELKAGYYLRTLTPAEEFGVFLQDRFCCLRDAARYEECFLWAARALQFNPDEPHFADAAHMVIDMGLRHRLKRVHPEQKIPPFDQPFLYNIGDLVRIEERSLVLTVTAHWQEAHGELEQARQTYEDACRQNFHGNNEQRDLQRFLKKHGLRRGRGPLLPPGEIGQPRRCQLFCRPEQEADQLRSLADEFEGKGELLRARDVLHDLYLFDPCDAEVFQRARALERQPRFQAQLKALIAQRRRELEVSKSVNGTASTVVRPNVILGENFQAQW